MNFTNTKQHKAKPPQNGRHRGVDMTNILLGELRHFIKDKTQKEAAKKLGISPQYLNDLLKQHRPITEKIAGKLGWKLQKTWVMK